MKQNIRLLLLLCVLLVAVACKKDPFDANSGSFTDKRDNHSYKWVKIGDQIWMAENLAYMPYFCTPDAQCGIYVYDYHGIGSLSVNYLTYGCLYNWETALKACPEGWHLPSDEEWMKLEQFLGMPLKELDREWDTRGENENVGGKLKETGFIHWNSPNTEATDEVGFSARAGGLYTYEFWGFSDRFWGINDAAVFWTVSQIYSNNAMYRSLGVLGKGITRAYGNKINHLSVRCIKD